MKCADCIAEGITTFRKAATGAAKNRCTTHHRAFKKAAKARAHENYVGREYGLLPGDYDAILAAQDGVCFICRKAKGITRKLAVDHNHELGNTREAVRGLLCQKCNYELLGHYDIGALVRAIEYLINPPARAVLRGE